MMAPLADHLWQSTVFALLAALLALLLRNNPARIRFTIWQIAAIKFLIPFALLIRIGHLFIPKDRPVPAQSFITVLQLATQPFGQSSAFLPTLRERFAAAAPALLGALWIAGTVTVVALWWLRWLQLARILKTSRPLEHGPELDFLRPLAAALGIKPLPILLSSSRFEPGIFGILHPVLLWPAEISHKLREPEIHAILAHEAWHVRRRDNLAAAVQMFIAAMFWFHPLVWWLGSRQMEERERACDEGTLELGNDPSVYAEGLLKTCKFSLEYPLPTVAGVNGSNLKKRITRIMNHSEIAALSLRRKLIVSTFALASIAGPVFFGIHSSTQAQAQSENSSAGPVQVTSLTRSSSGGPMVNTLFTHSPQGTSITNITVRGLIKLAYSVQDYQLTGGPAWIDQDHFDITYKGGGSPGPGLSPNADLQEILAQNFHLSLRQEVKPGTTYALVVADGGIKFPSAKPLNAPGTNEPLMHMRVYQKDGRGEISITGGPDGLADSLSSQLGHPVVDRTGLHGIYDINFEWSTANASADSISQDLQQQLGLSLAAQDGPVETTVIDSVTQPSGI